jgi:prevent-host-death family protein
VVILTIFHLVMKQTLSITEAKARFADVIKHTEHEPVVVTRDGTPVAVVVNIADDEDLRKTRAARQAGGLASIAGGWPRSAELADDLERLQRERRLPRRLPRGA